MEKQTAVAFTKSRFRKALHEAFLQNASRFEKRHQAEVQSLALIRDGVGTQLYFDKWCRNAQKELPLSGELF
jgi:hypothetical protein